MTKYSHVIGLYFCSNSNLQPATTAATSSGVEHDDSQTQITVKIEAHGEGTKGLFDLQEWEVKRSTRVVQLSQSQL